MYLSMCIDVPSALVGFVSDSPWQLVLLSMAIAISYPIDT